MPQWGVGLLAVFVVLGLSRTTWRKAGRLVFVITAIVIGAVMVSYMPPNPPPVFMKGPASQVAPPQPGIQQKPSAEDTTGRELYVTPAAIAAAQSAAAQDNAQQASSSSADGGANGQ